MDLRVRNRSGDSAATALKNLIDSKKVKTLMNIHVRNFVCMKNSLSFELEIIGEKQKVLLDFEPEEVDALKYAFQTGWRLRSEVEEVKQLLTNFLARNAEKDHVSFCFKHLKRLYLAASSFFSGCKGCYTERNKIVMKSLDESECHSLGAGGDAKLIIIELLLCCATRPWDNSDDSPHITLLAIEKRSRTVRFALQYLLTLFSCPFTQKCFPSGKSGLQLLIEESDWWNADADVSLDSVLCLLNEVEAFKDDDPVSMMITLLQAVTRGSHERLARICLLCNSLGSVQLQLSQIIRTVTRVLALIPKHMLVQVLCKVSFPYTAPTTARGFPNAVFFLISSVIGFSMLPQDIRPWITEGGAKWREMIRVKQPPCLRELAVLPSLRYILTTVPMQDGFVQVEKVINCQLLPRSVKEFLVVHSAFSCSESFSPKLTWEVDKKHHQCYDLIHSTTVHNVYEHAVESYLLRGGRGCSVLTALMRNCARNLHAGLVDGGLVHDETNVLKFLLFIAESDMCCYPSKDVPAHLRWNAE